LKKSIIFAFLLGGVVAASAAALDTSLSLPDLTWIEALILCVLHLLATQLHPLLDKRADIINSFAGGMSITYVFGHLLPELDEGHEVIGELIYLVVLIGFVVYYGLERHINKSRSTVEGGDDRAQLVISLGSYWVYNWLIVLGLPDGPSASLPHVLLMTAAMGLHLLHSDYDFGNEYPEMFKRWGRFLIASAPLVGLICRFYFQPEVEILKDTLTAILAGSVIYSVFKKELPYPERTNIVWFFVGILIYTFLLVLVRRV